MDCKHSKQYWLESVLKKLYKKVYSHRKHKNHQKKKLNVSATNIYTFKNKKREKIQRKLKQVKYQIVTRSKKQKNFQKRSPEKPPKKICSKYYEEKFWKFVDAFLKSRSFLSSTNSLFVPAIPSTVHNAHLKNIGNTLTLPSRIINHQASKKSDLPGDYGEERNLLTLRSRVVSRRASKKSDLPRDFGEEGNSLTLRSRVVSSRASKKSDLRRDLKDENAVSVGSRVISRRASNKSDLPRDYGEEGFLRSEMNSAGDQKALAQKIFLTIQKARMKRATDAIAKEVLGKRKAKKRFKKNMSTNLTVFM